ncbi:hypothetical protein CkaCkLH20_00877 [Colletotrichum karsti]|uniref:Xylanolytic transcriptional activator regulatory domain-containing protein n=1 Tax=Colletotrichum karsti TaxID=1095194 RepID=A0A9P6LQJ0_9PEZI|nr:uncharacterized protein CkaCkLH20_00877 [Colletotrichum karsti]KAF9881731.1 hypothetical protein CkaCkLH20_00877 [Colletotrichum karsti]
MASSSESPAPATAGEGSEDNSKKRIYNSAQETEAKLKAIEASLQQISQLRVTENAKTNSHEDGSNSSAPEIHRFPDISLPLLPLKDLFSGNELLAKLRSTKNQMEARMDPGGFPRKVFAYFPPREYMVDLEHSVIEEVQLFCPTLTRRSFIQLVDGQYTDEGAAFVDDPAQWAIMNALFGSALQFRMANDSFDHMARMGWGYFKNAFAAFGELVLSRTDLATCEAMLSLATFLIGTADARIISHIVSSAARVAHIIGLHRKESYANLDDDLANRYRRVCWVTHIVNTDLMIKYGLPTPFDQSKITTELPDEDFSDPHSLSGQSQGQESLNYVRKLAEISRIRSKIHENLTDTPGQSGLEHQTAVFALNTELEDWRLTLPKDSRPDLEAATTDRELDTCVVHLHFIYFNAVIKTHTTLARLNNVSSHAVALFRHPSWGSSQESCPIVKQAYAKVVAAARATIDILRVMPSQSFVQLWGMLHYPLTACLILLWASLEDPTGPEAHLNVRIIGQFVQFLAGLGEEGCDIRNMLDGCSKFFKVVKYAVHTQRAIRLTRPLEEDESVREQLEAFRQRLSGVADWTHLAQGLMSNMPVLCAQAREVFTDILDAEDSEPKGGYGPFAAEVLKPHNHNFTFCT